MTEKTRRGTRKAKSCLSTEINLTSSSDEDTSEEYFFTSSKLLSSNKTKLAKSSHPTTELLVNQIVSHGEQLHRALADTGARTSSIIIFTNETGICL
jgi:hypothetical protein